MKSTLSQYASFLTFLIVIQSGSLRAETENIFVANQGHQEYRLFDGHSLKGWQSTKKLPLSRGWNVEDGAIHRKDIHDIKSEHICWEDQEFGDFELSWQWKISPGGNSGVKYRVLNHQGRWLGFEYQLLDDDLHPNACDPRKTTGALYDLYAPNGKKRLNRVEQYNDSRVIARGCRIEHWLNGNKILEFDTSSEQWRNRIACSKFNIYPHFGKNEKGKILLQDHGHEVWFRNIVVRSLDKEP